ncbi:hypothetical protein HPB51_029572 [Rhipicephalus microplus]|uniref:DBC1/CARP1 catalytically inactive NUDIX hydrolase domain-containing protein n=1 Tax=Rhipicephalus microplus TaxID=6941 RepID=A0A9J6CU64_RHIMP|nr:hypothetical protein HPB51_029572 [Rhipicephalus microplus]
MLLSSPSLEELYQQTCALAEDESRSGTAMHPARVLSFLVGLKGKSETVAIGGPWSPSLDGPNPDSDPQTLIRTAVRTCRALTGIDLSACTQWIPEEVPEALSESEELIEGWECLDAGCSAGDFCTADDNLATCGARTVEDNVSEATCEVADSSNDDEEIDECDGKGPPPAAETLHALDVLRRSMAAEEMSDDTT